MGNGYKKYMKKELSQSEHNLIKIFIVSFCGTLLIVTFLIKLFSPSADVSIGDYSQESEVSGSVNVDGRLTSIQDEDRGRDFASLMKPAETSSEESKLSNEPVTDIVQEQTPLQGQTQEAAPVPSQNVQEPVYKVYIGSYTSSEQARVARDIIQETGSNLNPIVKCLGSNVYTLQVGIFRNKNSAETLLYSIQQNHLPGRIVQEY